MNAPRDSSWDEYMEKVLKDPEEATAYLEAVMEMNDPAAMLVALRHVARAHGMGEVTRRANMGEKTLYQTLSEKGNPTLDTIIKVLRAVGLRLSVAPITAAASEQEAHAA
jgi:probable addiction module antidote protein